jgi:hypothetical protein
MQALLFTPLKASEPTIPKRRKVILLPKKFLLINTIDISRNKSRQRDKPLLTPILDKGSTLLEDVHLVSLPYLYSQ